MATRSNGILYSLEPLTHFLTGACLSRGIGLNRKTALATTTLVLAAEAPDLDVLAYFKDPVFGFAHHRGITHTFAGIPLIAALVVGFMFLYWRWKQRRTPSKEPTPSALGGMVLPKTPRWGLLYGWAVVAGLSHILLDFTNNYGVRPFEPFSYRWFAWDIVFIFEPMLYIFLLGGLLLPALFGMINDEIGVRRTVPRGRGGAIAALILMAALWGFRDYQHRRAIATMEARLYHGAEPLRVAALPYYFNPFKWYGLVETEAFYERTIVDSLTPDVDKRGISLTRYKPEETDITEAAKATHLGRVYLDWARFPVTEVETLPAPQPGYLVRFLDLRFDYPDVQRRRPTLGATVLLDQNLRSVAEWFGVRSQRPDLTGEPSQGAK